MRKGEVEVQSERKKKKVVNSFVYASTDLDRVKSIKTLTNTDEVRNQNRQRESISARILVSCVGYRQITRRIKTDSDIVCV